MKNIRIDNIAIGEDNPCFIIAELSANHNHSIEKAKRLIALAKDAGADAVKIQTYTADTLTIKCENKYFKIDKGPWKGKSLYDLYSEAYTPWEWHQELRQCAKEHKIIFFSTPFDASAVDFLEKMEVPAYKIASFELIDLPLLRYVAKKGKPILLSTGMSTFSEIEEAVTTIKTEGNSSIVLLKCTSAYPAKPEEMHLSNIQLMQQLFKCPCGLSDHSKMNEIAIASVALGAKVIEKHFIENSTDNGPDAHFSTEYPEFKKMVQSIRCIEQSIGKTSFQSTESEKESVFFRRSLFFTEKIKKGSILNENNVRSIRPGFGISPKYLDVLLGKKAPYDFIRGMPVTIEDFTAICSANKKRKS
jgi:pseudaminic acid synthase